jgi:hypothetical protein
MRQRGNLPVLDSEPDAPRSSRPASLAPAIARTSVSRHITSLARSSRDWMRATSRSPQRVRGIAALLVICFAMLFTSAGVKSDSVQSRGDTPATAAVPTATLWPTTTPTPLPPPPLNMPAGWQVYRGHHFAVAYPPGWTDAEHVVQDGDDQTVEASVSFNSDDGNYSVGIAEREGLDAATLKQYCDTPGTHTTYAGLPMITSLTAGTLRMYTFISAGGVAYTMLCRQDESSSDILYLYNTMLASFRPEVTTSACG